MTRRTAPFTPDELALITTTRDDWMREGLRTDPIDRTTAQAAIRDVYRTAGLAEPTTWIWMTSPLGVVLAGSLLSSAPKKGQLRDQLGDQLRDQLRGQLGDQLGGQLRGQLGGQLRDQLGDQLRDQLGDQLRDQLGDQLRDQLGDQLRDQLRGQLRGQPAALVWQQVWGAWESYWLAFYDVGLRVSAESPLRPRLDAMMTAARTCGAWLPFEGAVIVGDRPHRIRRENGGRLHSADGPALAYADGYGVWAWRGMRVPQWVVENPTLERIGVESNTEIRRCAIESFGWDRYLAELGVTPVSVEADPGNPGHELALYDLPDRAQLYGDRVRLLVMENASLDKGGTRRRYGETVPASCATAIDAVAWQFDCKPDLYRQLARAT